MANQLVTPCPEQLMLSDVFGCTLSEDYAAQLPLTGVLLNPRAKAMGVQNKLIDPITGQTKKVQIGWTNEICATPSDNCITDYCTADPVDIIQNTIEIENDPCGADIKGSIKYKIPYKQVEEANNFILKAPEGMFEMNFASGGNNVQMTHYQMLKKLEQKAEAEIAAKLVSLILPNGGFSTLEEGVTFTTGTPKAKIVKTFGNVPSAGFSSYNDAYSEIIESAELARFCVNPIVIGGKSLAQYMMQMENGCCASNGFDIASYVNQYNVSFVRSTELMKVLPQNQFISIELGALRHFSYFQFAGQMGWEKGSSFRKTIQSPWTGRYFDFTGKFDDCTGDMIYTMAYAEDLFALPNKFCAGDHREGVNGIQLFEIQNL